MREMIQKGLKGLLIVILLMGFAFTVQADDDDDDDENKGNDKTKGPTVEICETKKDGTEKCKTKELKGQKAIIFLYEELLKLQTDTDDLQNDIQVIQNDMPAEIINLVLSNPTILGIMSEIQNLSEDIATLTTSINALEGRVQGAETAIGELQSTIETLSQRLSATEDAIAQFNPKEVFQQKITAGGSHTCALVGGTVQCWG